MVQGTKKEPNQPDMQFGAFARLFFAAAAGVYKLHNWFRSHSFALHKEAQKANG